MYEIGRYNILKPYLLTFKTLDLSCRLKFYPHWYKLNIEYTKYEIIEQPKVLMNLLNFKILNK